MADESRALYQPFLPDNRHRAFVWKYAQAIGGRRPRHFHGEPELNLVVSGSATFGVGDRAVRVSRGELLAFPSGQDHVLLDASPDLYLYAIGLDPTYSAAVLGVACEPVAPLHVRLATDELDRLIDRAAAIVDLSGAEQLAAELWQRVHWLGRRAVDRAGRAPHVLSRRALRLMSTTPELGLDALADELRTHPSEVSRHFHRDVGMTLVRYRMRLRLLQFIRLVDAGRGFDVRRRRRRLWLVLQCHRAFRAELGRAPRGFFFSELRERMQVAYVRSPAGV